MEAAMAAPATLTLVAAMAAGPTGAARGEAAMSRAALVGAVEVGAVEVGVEIGNGRAAEVPPGMARGASVQLERPAMGVVGLTKVATANGIKGDSRF